MLVADQPAPPAYAPQVENVGTIISPVQLAIGQPALISALPAAGMLAEGVAVEVGRTICLDIPLGLNHHQRLSGVLEGVAGAEATIRLVAMDGTWASMQGKMVRVGAVLSDKLSRWKLCDD